MAVVYFHRRKDNNEVFYVGIGKRKNRAYVKSRRNSYWNNIVKKYGYNVEIVHKGISYDKALELEQHYIKEFGRDNLTNMTDGGEGTLGLSSWNKGRPLTKEERQKVSDATKKAMSDPDVIARLIEGRKNYQYTDQHRKSISDANKRLGRKPPQTQADREWTKESRDKVRKNQTGEGNSNAVLTIEQVRFIKKNYKKFSKEWGGTALAKKLGVSSGTVYAVTSGNNWSWVKV